MVPKRVFCRRGTVGWQTKQNCNVLHGQQEGQDEQEHGTQTTESRLSVTPRSRGNVSICFVGSRAPRPLGRELLEERPKCFLFIPSIALPGTQKNLS